MTDTLALLHFIRPQWLWAILPLLALLWLFYHRARQNNDWQKIIDAHLLDYLLPEQKYKKRKNLLLVLIIISFLSVLALSGVSFWQQKTPIYALDKLQVILVDASPSTYTNDVKPSRFERSILLIRQLLKQNQEGEVMLIAFSGEPYVISPATSDDKPILNLLSGFTQETLPVKGYRLDLALQYTQDLLKKYSNKQVDILLLTDTDRIGGKSLALAESLAKSSYRLSVIAVASDKRVPILGKNGTLKDSRGKVILAKVNQRLLEILATKGNGLYQRLDNDAQNIKRYLEFSQAKILEFQLKKQQKSSVRRVDFGVFISLLLLPLVLLLFRYGYLLFLVLAFYTLEPTPLYAQQNLSPVATMWQTQNEKAQALYERGQYEAAAELFQDLSWRANTLYKAEQYEKAAQLFTELGEYYNSGNAYAQLEQYTKAIKAYEKALQEYQEKYKNATPAHQQKYKTKLEDTQNNVAFVRKKQQEKKQQQQNQQSQQGKNQKNQQNKQSQQDKDKKQAQQAQDKKQGDPSDQLVQTKDKDQEKAKEQVQNNQMTKAEKDKKAKEKQKAIARQTQTNRQKLQPYFQKVQTQPIELLKQKFLIERHYRQQNQSQFINQQQEQSW